MISLFSIIVTLAFLGNLAAQTPLWTTLSDGSQIYYIAAGSHDTVYQISDNGLSRSADGGLNWTFVTTEISGPSIKILSVKGHLLAFDSSVRKSDDGGVSWKFILVTPKIYTFNLNGVLLVSDGTKITESTDFGDTWIDITFDFPSTSVLGLVLAENGDASADHPVTLYDRRGCPHLVTRSKILNRGTGSWSDGFMLPNAFTSSYMLADYGGWINGKIHNFSTYQGMYAKSFYAESNGLVLAMVGDSLLLSLDTGHTWLLASIQYLHFQPTGCWKDAAGNLYLLANAIYKSMDRGKSWQLLFGGLPVPVTDFHLLRNGAYYAAAQGSIFRSYDMGKRWECLYRGCSCGARGPKVIKLSIFSDSIMYSVTGGFIRTTDGGENWVVPSKTNFQWIYRSKLLPSGLILFVTDLGIYSSNNGVTMAQKLLILPYYRKDFRHTHPCELLYPEADLEMIHLTTLIFYPNTLTISLRYTVSDLTIDGYLLSHIPIKYILHMEDV